MTDQQPVNHQHIITDHLTNKDELYMRTINIYLQDDPHGWGYLTVCACPKEGKWERASFSVTCNITVDRLPYFQEAIDIASKWLTVDPDSWKQLGESWNYKFETMGGKAVYEAANKQTEDYYKRNRKKRK